MRYQLWQYLYIHILSSGACKNSQSSSFLLYRVWCEGTFTGHPITRFMEVHQNNLSPLLEAFLWKGNTILPIISDGVFVKQSKMHTITPTAGPSIQIYVDNETPQTIWPFLALDGCHIMYCELHHVMASIVCGQLLGNFDQLWELHWKAVGWFLLNP